MLVSSSSGEEGLSLGCMVMICKAVKVQSRDYIGCLRGLMLEICREKEPGIKESSTIDRKVLQDAILSVANNNKAVKDETNAA